jgi:signal transduction histidine kinase
LINKLFRLLGPDAEDKGIRLNLDIESGTDTTLSADAAQMEQVFLNLALNAIAAKPNGGVLHFRISKSEEMLQIEVGDTGKGIPAEIQSKIFEPYFTTRSDGTGMGLALCDKIIRQHDGSIDFQTSSKGTAFTILLPVMTETSEIK